MEKAAISGLFLCSLDVELNWLRGLDLNQRPLGYEPNELPGCSTPHLHLIKLVNGGQLRASGRATLIAGT